jgi:hypothetical protein
MVTPLRDWRLLAFAATAAFSGCSSDTRDPAIEPPAAAVGAVSQEVLNDGCFLGSRNRCAAFGCGCLNDRCSGGFCPLRIDGCSDQQRSTCAASSCGCWNGSCSGGSCPPLSDGCTEQQRESCALVACGCSNGHCSGGACQPLVDGCTQPKRLACATTDPLSNGSGATPGMAGGPGFCGCSNGTCVAGADESPFRCPPPNDGCTDENRSRCARFAAGCKQNQCWGGSLGGASGQ